MFFTMKVLMFTFNYINQITAYLLGGVTPCTLIAGNVRLMTAFSVAPNRNSVPADFTEATFAGYGAQPIAPALGGPVNLPNEAGESLYGQLPFVASSLLSPGGQTIVGYWIDDGAIPPHVLAAEIFPAGLPIANPGDALFLNVVIPNLFQVPTGY